MKILQLLTEYRCNKRARQDEATSAPDAANEESFYRRLAAMQTTLVSVGHRLTIVKYHKQVLELCGEGEWQLHPAEDYDFRR